MTLRMTMLAILIPLVAILGGLTYKSYVQSQARLDVLAKAQTVVAEVRLLNDAVHELQKERGYSAGFLSSQGAKFAAELQKQRIATDAAIAALSVPLPLTRAAAPERMQAIDTALTKLASWRARVSEHEFSVAQMAGNYTGVIQNFLDAGAMTTPGAISHDLAALLTAKTFLSQAKENAGLERAMGATGLGAGAFKPAIHTNFVSLGAAQMSLLISATKQIDRPELMERIQLDAAAAEVFRMRRILTASVHGGGFEDLTAGQWFQTSTNWINLLRAVELELAEEIASLAVSDTAMLKAQQVREIGTVTLAVVATLLFSATLFERMIYRIRRLVGIMSAYRENNFEEDVPYTNGRSEINVMAGAIHQFKEETLANRRAMEDAKAKDEAVLHAKHQRVVDLVTEGLAALANADLRLQFDDPLDAEYDQIRKDFNCATERLRFVLVDLSESVRELSDRAVETARGSEELAERTEQQDNTLRDTGASMDLLTRAVEGDHEKLEAASAAAGTARENAGNSGEIMREAVVAMDRISESSEKISQIISLIDEISFQTNLLALNAGVEAARAGEAGRGFAVVASEVRALAGRSSEAALDIKTLINESRQQVQQGVDLVARAGDSLETIFQQIEDVDGMLGTVSESSRKQATDLSQVNQAMVTLQNLTEANSVMVSDTRTVSTTLAELAARLSDGIGEFRLTDPARSGGDPEMWESETGGRTAA